MPLILDENMLPINDNGVNWDMYRDQFEMPYLGIENDQLFQNKELNFSQTNQRYQSQSIFENGGPGLLESSQIDNQSDD